MFTYNQIKFWINKFQIIKKYPHKNIILEKMLVEIFENKKFFISQKFNSNNK